MQNFVGDIWKIMFFVENCHITIPILLKYFVKQLYTYARVIIIWFVDF